MLEIKHVSKKYKDKVIFDDLNLAFNSYGIYGICGDSGIGKSTLLNIISGYDQDYTGEILWHHEEISKEDISFVFQEFHLVNNWKGNENILTYSYFREYDSTSYMDHFLKRKVRKLSGGQKQRTAVYRAFNSNASIILCDEPTASLDEDNASKVMEILKEKSKDHLIIVVSHDIALLETYCDDIYDLSNLQYKEAIESKYIKEKHEEEGNTFKLLLLNLKTHFLDYMHLFPGFMISILCFMFCFSLADGYTSYFIKEMKSILPDQQYIFMKQNMDEKDIKNIDSLYTYINIKDFEITGVGNDQVLVFPQDLSKRSKHLYLGKTARKDQEIIVNKTMARHLAGNKDIKNIIGKTYKMVLTYKDTIKYMDIKVCGIEDDDTALDVIYLYEFSNVEWCKQMSKDYVIDSVFIESDTPLKQLKQKYNSYKIHSVNEKVTQQIIKYTKMIKYITFIIAGIMMVLSFLLFYITVNFNFIREEKNYMIFLCFGAMKEQLCVLVTLENVMVMTIVEIISYVVFKVLTMNINQYLKTVLGSANTVSLHYGLCFLVTLIVYTILTIFLSILPSIKIAKLEPIKLLNH